MGKILKIIAILLLTFLVVMVLINTIRSVQCGDSDSNPVNEGHLGVSLPQGSYFGNSAVLGEDVLVVGVYDGGDSGYPQVKDLYIFEKSMCGWKKVQKISKSDIQSEFFDGTNSSISSPKFEFASLYDGKLIVPEVVPEIDSKKMYLHFFEKQRDRWVHTKTESIQDVKSNTSDFRAIESYFQSFSFFDETLAFGFHDNFFYPTANSGGEITRPDDITDIESVLIFEKDSSGWQKTHRIATHIDDVTEGPYTSIDVDRRFAKAVALNEDVLVIGSENDNPVFIFERVNNTWKQVLKISQNSGGSGFLNVNLPKERNGTYFGNAVALQGNLLAVGVSRYGDYVYSPSEQSHGDYGAVYLFEKMEGGWKQVVRISHDSKDLSVAIDPDDNFGSSVALFGNILAVGASGDGEVTDSQFGGCMKMNRGAVYLFERNREGSWKQVLKISDEKDKKSMWSSLCNPHHVK